MSVDLEDPTEKVYDDNKPGWRTNLTDDGLEDAFDAPAATDDNLPEGHPDRSDAATPTQLNNAEQEAAGPSEPASMFPMEEGWFKGIDDAKGFKGVTKVVAKGLLTRRGALGLGAGGGIVTIFILLFFALLPLKLNMIMENLESKYFSGNNSALGTRMDIMFNTYVKQKLLPALNKPGCGNTRTIDKNCVSVSPGDTPFDRLSNAWREGRLENKMANDYGIELSRATNSNEFTIKINGQVSTQDIEGFRKNPDSSLWQAVGNRTDARRTLNKALEGETKFKQIVYRVKFAKYLQKKYGVTYCLVYCEKRDRFADKIENARSALKLAVVQKVLVPRTNTLGLALTCILDSNCVNDPPSREGNAPDDFERKDQLQKNVAKYLEQSSASLSSESIEKIAGTVSDITEAGSFGRYISIKIAEQVAGETGKQLATDSLPVVGWINVAATLINKAATIGPKLKKFNYVLASTAAVSLYMTYRSYADEQKGGYTDPEVAKSMASGLGDTVGDKDHVGQTAEMSPAYQSLFGSSNQTTAFDSIFPSAAAASTVKSYTCDDNQPVANGADGCPEESFLLNNPVTAVSDAFNLPGLSLLKGAAGVWTGTVGKIAGIFGSAANAVLSAIPGYDELQKTIGDKAGELMTSLGKKVFKSAVSDNMSGARTFQVLTAGASSAASSAAEYSLGGAKISSQQASALLASQEQEADQNFAHESLFARLFDRNNTRSLVGQMAMAMPMEANTTTTQLASALIKNPFTTLASSFSTLFVGRAKAAATLPNPGGITFMGYAQGDPNLNIDPLKLTKAYCADFNNKWADDVTPDPVTGMDIHTTTNPCLLDSAVTAGGGGLFSDDALNDTASTDPNGTGVGTTTTNTASPTSPVKGDSYTTTTCTAGTDVSPAGGADGYSGGQRYKIRICKVQGIIVNASIASNVNNLINTARAQGLKLTGGGFRTMQDQINTRIANHCPDIYNSPPRSCHPQTARPGYSNHQMGFAIDFGNSGSHDTAVYKWLDANASSFGLKNLPPEPWHWSIDGK